MTTSCCAVTLFNATHDLESFSVRIGLACLGIDYELSCVDVFPGTDQPSRAALALSPTGRLPILQFSDQVLCGASTILLALAKHHDPHHNLAADSELPAVQRWLQFADTQLAAVGKARSAALFGYGASPEQVGAARAALLVLEDELSVRQLRGLDWLAAPSATIADIAVYPAVALMRDIGLEYGRFPALRRWMGKARDLAPRESMPGILDVR